MNNQNNGLLSLREILSYFEKSDLQIPKKFFENFIQFNKTVEMLKGYKSNLRDVYYEKLIQLEHLQVIDRDLNEIKTILIKLKSIYSDNTTFFTRLYNIMNDSSGLVKKIRYVSNMGTDAFGRHVSNPYYSYFYTIIHSKLFDLLINAKDLVKSMSPVDNIYQNFPICQKVKELIEILPTIKDEYLSDVLYIKIPNSIERIINLSNDLKELMHWFVFLFENEFLEGLVQTVINNFQGIQVYFSGREIRIGQKIKLRGKFKNAYSALSELYHSLLIDVKESEIPEISLSLDKNAEVVFASLHKRKNFRIKVRNQSNRSMTRVKLIVNGLDELNLSDEYRFIGTIGMKSWSDEKFTILPKDLGSFVLTAMVTSAEGHSLTKKIEVQVTEKLAS
ncbi:MAG: hypothetical protein ACFFBF_15755 [Promethearchaeota archaeon]